MKIIKIDINENQEPVVSGRELHEKLEVQTPYDKWMPRMIEYGFTENIDFSTFLSESTGGRPATDHLLKLDMAKEIAMIQRTDKGKQVRQYFLEIEKEYNSPEKIMARALRIAEKELNTLKLELNVKRPADSRNATESKLLRHDTAMQGFDIRHGNCKRLRYER